MAKLGKKVSAFLLIAALLISLAPGVLAEDTEAFSIVSVEINPIEIIEGTSCEQKSNPDTGFYYLYDWVQLVSGTATFSDGAAVDFTAPGFAYEGQQYTLSGSDVQFMEHWDGGYTFSVKLNFIDESGATCFTASPAVTIAHDLDDATDPRVCKVCGNTEDKTTWEFDETTGILTIGGTGPMKDYSQITYHTPPWMWSTVTSAVIGEGVTHIGDISFYDQRLSSVSLPSTLTSIGDEAFSHGGLAEVKLPNGLISIGEEAFLGTGLTEVIIPASVTTIGRAAFQTYMLTTITFLGDAPTGFDTNPYMAPSIIPGLTVTIKYPADNATWTEEVKAYWSENADITWETFEHDWLDATCTAPKTCQECGTTVGEALGHDYVDVTCTAPKTCKVCAATEGEALGHDFADATCTAPKTCKVCAATEGEALGHDYADATCTAPRTCKLCGATQGGTLMHDWADATCTTPRTCKVCGTTTGQPNDHMDDDMDCKCDMCGAAVDPYPIVSIEVEPMTIIEETNGEWFSPIPKPDYFEYYWHRTIKGTVTFLDGTTQEFEAISSPTGSRPAMVEYNGETYFLYGSSSQADNPWKAGNTYTGEVHVEGGPAKLYGEAKITIAHDATEATCTTAGICNICGATVEEALGHDFTDATCTAPKTCKDCGVTEGEALGHDYADATCTAPKTCKVCAATEGAAIDHTDANTDNKCDMCEKLMKEVDIDVDNDGKADINLDTDADGKADLNIDRDGDNKADLNIDKDGDGKADENVDTDGDGLPNYEVVEGNNGQHEKTEQNDLVFKVNGLFSGFQKLVLNDQVVPAEYYEVREGSTIVTLKGSYLAALEEGSYQLTVVYTDGTADYSFNVAEEEPTKPESDVPQTGDNADTLLWVLLLTLSAAAMVCIVVFQKKRNFR